MTEWLKSEAAFWQKYVFISNILPPQNQADP